MQTFRIPDRTTAPVVLQKLARLDKDDVFAPPATKASTTVLKWFFATASIGIAATTSLGLWMALAYGRRRCLLWTLLAAGVPAPILILAF